MIRPDDMPAPNRVEVRGRTRAVLDAAAPVAGFLVIGVASPAWVRRVMAAVPDGDPRLERVTTLEPPKGYKRFGVGPTTHFHLRIRQRSDLTLLPGLDERGEDVLPAPSLLREAADIALTGGSAFVEVVVISMPRAVPWRLGPPDVRDDLPWPPSDLPSLVEGPAAVARRLFEGPLEELLAARPANLVVLPDANGPPTVSDHPRRWQSSWPRGDTSLDRAQRWVLNMTSLVRLAARYRQIVLADVPHDLGDDGCGAALAGLLDADLLDAAPCTWSTTGVQAEAQFAEHGWRPACAAVAAGLSPGAGERPGGRGLLGRQLRIGPGRRLAKASVQPAFHAAHHPVVTLVVEPDGVQATTVREPTLLRPLGRWSLTAILTARRLLTAVEATAFRFVFQWATDRSASDLRSALLQCLGVFVNDGVLRLGDPEAKEPGLEVVARPDPGEPKLVATIQAVLYPWVVRILVDVEVGLNGQTRVWLA